MPANERGQSLGGTALSISGGEAIAKSGAWRWVPPCEPEDSFFISVEEVSSRLWAEETDQSWSTNSEVRVT